MVEDVVGVVPGLDLGEPPVGRIAVGRSNAAAVVVGIEEVDVDAARAVRSKGFQEPTRSARLEVEIVVVPSVLRLVDAAAR